MGIDEMMEENLDLKNDKDWNRGRVKALVERYYRENGWEEKENLPHEEMITLIEYIIEELNL